MLPVTLRRVFMAQHRVDFRRRFDGLLAESYRMGANPYDGDCVLFVKRDHTQLRALVGDPVGLFWVCRRFEGGRLKPLLTVSSNPAASPISLAERSLLLEGAAFTIHGREAEGPHSAAQARHGHPAQIGTTLEERHP